MRVLIFTTYSLPNIDLDCIIQNIYRLYNPKL